MIVAGCVTAKTAAFERRALAPPIVVVLLSRAFDMLRHATWPDARVSVLVSFANCDMCHPVRRQFKPAENEGSSDD
jgi:hypothetical protein